MKAFAFGQLGIKPIEFSLMSYRDYCLTCIGHKDKRLNDARRQRQSDWLLLLSFADHKKIPRTIYEWQPLEGDVIPKFERPTPERLLEMDNKFRNINRGRK